MRPSQCKRTAITCEELKVLLDYNPITGVFKSRINTQRWKIGYVIGSPRRDGYCSVMIHGKNYLMHRLAFLYMEGSLPTGIVDHINGVRNDNRWENLRHADYTLNSRNSGISSNNTSGIVGVSWHKKAKKWQAFVSVDSKPIYLGLFDSIEAAQIAREKSMKLYNYPEVKR